MLFQSKIILKQILICVNGMDTRISQNISVIAIFHVSLTSEYDFVLERKVFDHSTRSPLTRHNKMAVINC
jgi:hypothetical protein